MRTSEKTEAISEALAKAQAEYPPLKRNRTVIVKTKTGGSYEFTYATLDHILDTFRPILSKHGLSIASAAGFVKPFDNSNSHESVLVVRLSHASGQWLEAEMPLGGWENDQELGSRLTYRSRYMICLLLGICAEEDDDGSRASGNDATFKDKKPAPRAAPPATDGKYRLPLEEALMAIEACKDVTELMRVFQEKTSGKPPEFVEAVRAKASAKKAQLQPTT